MTIGIHWEPGETTMVQFMHVNGGLTFSIPNYYCGDKEWIQLDPISDEIIINETDKPLVDFRVHMIY